MVRFRSSLEHLNIYIIGWATAYSSMGRVDTGKSSEKSTSKQLKWIIVTGGVLSGLGKGVAAASIGNLLAPKYKVVPIKADGYLNVDPGTMNPIEHGEVFVLDDGGEVDMDFGHYERFLGVTCKFGWNLTMGKVFDQVREKERRGDFLGKTVQMIPHVTELIKEWWKKVAAEENADVVLLEVGGTVGDIENELYIEAARQLKREVGDENILYVHLTYVPKPEHVNEHKTKPTQQSVSMLRSRGIFPEVILARCHEHLSDKEREKISIFCDVKPERVISAVDVESIYSIPINFSEQGMLQIIDEELGLNSLNPDPEWRNLVETLTAEHTKRITIAVAGKYTALEDSYASIIEALHHCEAAFDVGIDLKWIETSDEHDLKNEMEDVDGVIVPGGFGSRGVEGKISMVQYCREHDIPYLGICYGLQMAIIEFARNVCGLQGANTTEVDENTKHPVVDILPEQKQVTKKGGTMRLGAYPAVIKKGTMVYDLYEQQEEVSERHRHRYEVNPEFHQILEENGMVFSGVSPDGTLVEFIENPKLKYFAATQGHPELKSSLKKPAPLFYGLVKACLE
jgi:CTP synthase